jgi:hypothetical protein
MRIWVGSWRSRSGNFFTPIRKLRGTLLHHQGTKTQTEKAQDLLAPRALAVTSQSMQLILGVCRPFRFQDDPGGIIVYPDSVVSQEIHAENAVNLLTQLHIHHCHRKVCLAHLPTLD